MRVQNYFEELSVEMTVEFDSLETQVDMIVRIHSVEVHVEITVGK